MSRLIDADKLEKELDLVPILELKENCGYIAALVSLVQVLNVIDRQPPVEPGKKKGKWVAVGEHYVKCSECDLETTKNELRGIALFGENEPYFCPNCGADMRGENHEQT